MNYDLIELKKEFIRIKNLGKIKSLRNGPTGVGYTFECLLNKKEDQECRPDFKSIELKCKLGYTKTPLSMFNFTPTRYNESAINYIYNNYAYHHYGNLDGYKLFQRKVFSKSIYNLYGYEFKLDVNYLYQEIVMKSYKNGEFIENVCYWDFKTLENKLKVKLSNLAIIEAYPYKVNGELYYKYFTLKNYKLRGFLEFLKLIEEDKIYVEFYLKEKINKNGEKVIENHGVTFKLKLESIEELFYKIKV